MTNFTELATKKDRKAHIKMMLGTNPQWAMRGLIRIFRNQTDDEQRCETTKEHNGIGFTGVDAEILTSFAKQVIAGRSLSTKQLAILHKKMPKYASQLERVAE